MKLSFKRRGSGPILVMLHGLFGSGDNLGGIARVLEQHYTVVSMDLRNHGRSPHANSVSYPDMAADVLETMALEGIQSAHVFGHSMGGKVAMQMALGNAEQVEKLIVCDIAPVAYGPNHRQIMDGMLAVADKAPQTRSDAQVLLRVYVDEPDVLGFLMTNWRKNADGIWAWRINLQAIHDYYSDIAAAVTGQSFGGPTLFIRGGNSQYIKAEYKEQILSLFPHAVVKTVENTGHWLHAEKPDLVARMILRFLEAS